MQKVLFSLVLAAVVAVPAVSSAAVTHLLSGFEVNDKDVTSVRAGSTVKVTSRMNVPLGDEVEYARTYVMDTNGTIVAEECDAVISRWVGVKNNAEFNSSVKIPAYLPDQGLTVGRQTFGIPGTMQSDKCDPDNLNGSAEYEGILFVDQDSSLTNVDDSVGNTGNTGTTPVGGVFGFTSFAEFMAAVRTSLGMGSTPTPGRPAVCTGLDEKAAAASYGRSSGANETLQRHLMLGGYSIPALLTGVPFGYFGPQTSHALTSAQEDCR